VESVKKLLFAFATIASLWALAIFLSGGFNVRLLGIRVSSQTPYRAAMFAVASAAIAATLHAAHSESGHRRRDWLRPELIVVALGVALLVDQWVAARPLWLDEEMIALNVRDRPFRGLVDRLSFEQSAPFAWLLLERAALLSLGPSELWLRLAPALFGIGTLLCALWIGRRWMTPIGATVLALLCSFGQWLSFYAVELKHYSADAFAGLFLPALTVWAAEANGSEIRKRLLVWGAAIAVAHWFSIGALLVTPACGAVLTVALMRNRSRPAILYLCGIAGICAVSFAAHYAAALHHARESAYLKSFWQFAFPPESAGAAGHVVWLRDQLGDFAMKPGGTELAVLFWASAFGGFVLTSQRLLGSVAAAVVVSGFLFASLRIVPLYERLSLWFVPALYLGVALFADSSASFARKSRGTHGWVFAGAATIIAIVAFQVSSDIFRHGADDVRNFRPADSNRSTDDRTAVSWLMSQRRPEDAVVTTRLGVPAVLWYGNLTLLNSAADAFRGSEPILVAEHSSSESECDARRLRSQLKGSHRVLAYLGFQDFPKWFDDQLLQELADSGSVTALRHFGSTSRAAVVDLTAPVPASGERRQWEDAADEPHSQFYGCIIAREARRW
jgi:hypothetical protein